MFALVLSGGSIRGAVHAGFIAVLEEEGIIPDLIVGSSAGSIVAALYAADTTPFFALNKLTEQNSVPIAVDWRLPFLPFTWLRKIIGRLFGIPMGLLPPSRLIQLLKPFLDGKTFSQLKVPIAIVTCDIQDGSTVVFTPARPATQPPGIVFSDTAPVIAAVAASSSIPGLFAPQRIGSRLLVDGGVVNNCPADIARYLGADKVLAVNLGFSVKSETPPSNGIEVLLQSVDIMGKKITAHITQTYADLTLTPDTGEVSLLDWDEIPRLYRQGRQLALENLEHIRRLMLQ